MLNSLPVLSDKFQRISLIFEAECDTSVTRFDPQVAIEVRKGFGAVLDNSEMGYHGEHEKVTDKSG